MMGVHRKLFAVYDIQDSPHSNPNNYRPKIIQPHQPHRHVYNEHAMKYHGVWDRFADVLESVEKGYDRLSSQFLIDMKVRFSDSPSQTAFLGFM